MNILRLRLRGVTAAAQIRCHTARLPATILSQRVAGNDGMAAAHDGREPLHFRSFLCARF
jgi:hypothetical protein